MTSQSVLAAPPRLCPECRIAIIKEGKPAPWDGILYDNYTFAYEKAQRDARDEEIKNELEYKHKLEVIDLKLTTATTAAALESVRAEKDGRLQAKMQRIVELEKDLVRAEERAGKSNEILWYSIGFGSGVAVAILSAWAYSKVAAAQR